MTTTDTRHTTRDTRKLFNVRHSTRTSAFPHFRTSSLPRTAFTLIEMLIVISIISVLLGLLYGALERARTFSRRAIAYTEVKNIETAFKQYYAHYHDWPPETCIEAADTRLSGSQGDDKGFVIDANMAKMLQGTISDSDGLNTTIKAANPDRIPFIEFARKNNTGVPINPFRLSTGSTETRQYKVLFDLDNDNEIGVRDDLAVSNVTVYASVAVWTMIPGSPSEDNTDTTVSYELIGSWHPFSK